MDQNYLLLNRAFCIPIASENAKCHPDLGDGRKSYKANNFYVLQLGEQWFVMLEADKDGNNRTMTDEKLDEYKDLFGRENVKTLDYWIKVQSETEGGL